MKIGSDNWNALIRKGADRFGVELDQQAVDRFALHARELLRWNEKINLTAITAAREIAVKHFLDALTAGSELPDTGTLLDVGTGAGFPGIPLKIIQPCLDVVLIDASRKKVSFLKHVLRLLELKGLDAHHLRADELVLQIKEPDPNARQAAGEPLPRGAPFDVVISRALASLNDFVRLSLPLVRRNGRIIALKGRVSDSEIDALNRQIDRFQKMTGSRVHDFRVSVKRFKLPFCEADRTVVTIAL
jgi:16S rRNA (guanine527-N7)-methyltransferase